MLGAIVNVTITHRKDPDLKNPENDEMIRKAVEEDLDAVENIYDEIHDAEECGEISIGWIRGIYPTRKTAEDSLKRGDLFVLEDRSVLGAGIINQIQVDSYEKGAWEYEAEDNEVCVLHTLVISPKAGGKGYGKQFVKFYEDYAGKLGCHELRLDTNEKNKRAREMYRKLGYKEVGIVPTDFNEIPDVNLVLLEKRI